MENIIKVELHLNFAGKLLVQKFKDSNFATAEPQEKIGAVLDMYLTSESTGEKNAYVKFAYLQCLKIRKDIFTIYLKHKHSESELDLKEVTGLDLFDTMLTEIKAFGFNKNIQVMFKK